jgi:putative ABC transport system substrate-binding protein
MRQREFIAGLGGAVAWPLAVRAKQRERVRRVGVLMGLARDDPDATMRLAMFRQTLEKLGWSEAATSALTTTRQRPARNKRTASQRTWLVWDPM